MKKILIGTTALCALAGASQGFAQTTPVDENGIVEVVVTAQHRRESAQRAPLAITAISGDEALKQGKTTVSSVLDDTPSVVIQNTPQGGQVFIRGVGANGDSNWVDPAVSLMLDGVYTGRSELVLSNMYDVSRVEVLRGPQGTLYGRNATGGTVNVVTNAPGDQFGGAVNMQVGNFNLRHIDFAVNLPISDQFAIRVAALRETRDGYFSNNGRASDASGVRLKALYRPSDRISLLGTIDHYKNDGDGVTTVPREYDSSVPPFVTWRTDYSDPWEVDPLHPADEQRLKFTTYALQGDFDLGFGTLTVIPAVSKSSRYVNGNLVVGTAIPGNIEANTWEETQKTLEVRLASPETSRIKWVMGLYAYDSDNYQTGKAPSTTPVTYESYDMRVPATSYAAFAQLTYPVSDALRLTAGLRHTKDEKNFNYGIKSLIGSYDSGLQQVTASYDATTYKLGVEYDLSARSLFYGHIASGYKAGGYSTSLIPPGSYEPEELTAIEIGSKNRLFENRLQLNVAVYHYEYENYQIQYPVYTAPSPNPDDAEGTVGFAQYVLNADTGTNKGAELEARYLFPTGTIVRYGFTYTDARYGKMNSADLSYLDDTAVINTPKTTHSLGLTHDVRLWAGIVTMDIQTKWSEGYRIGLDRGLPGGDQNLYQPSFRRSDLRVSYVPDQGQWSLALWGRNLENEAQLTQALPFGRVQISNPRTFGLNLSTKF
ncbi:MAG: TonB-dependent receptor [Asticcacaulis sp.]